MDSAANARRLPAFLIVTLSALCVPVFGIAAFIVLVPAFASSVAGMKGGTGFLYFIPGAALAAALCFALGVSPTFYGALLAAALVCGGALGVAIRKGAGATMQAVVTSAVLVALLAAIALGFALAQFGSVKDAVSAAYDAAVRAFSSFSGLLDAAIERYAEADPRGAETLALYSLSGLDPDEVVGSLIVSIPGLFAAAAFVFGWIAQLLSRLFLLIFGRRDLITADRRLTVPVSLAVAFFVLRVMTFFVSGESFVFICLSNVVEALYPMMMLVGGGFLLEMTRTSRSRFSIMFIIIFALSAFFMPAVFVSALSIAGVIGTVVRAIREKRESE